MLANNIQLAFVGTADAFSIAYHDSASNWCQIINSSLVVGYEIVAAE